MAVGKNKRVSKGGKKGGKKKVVDAFSKKEWYTVRAPSLFNNPACGNTLVNRTQGLKLSSDNLKGRVCEVNLADLQTDEDQCHKNVRLIVEEVNGRNCLTDFHGMSLTRDHMCSLIRKWHTLIEANVDVKTADGYTVRMFCLAFTKRRSNQEKATCYAQTSQIRAIRKQMVKIMEEEASKSQLRELVKKLIPEAIGKAIGKACARIFPLNHVCIRKVKVIKRPKTDIARLMELHSSVATATAGAPENAEAKNLLTTPEVAA